MTDHVIKADASLEDAARAPSDALDGTAHLLAPGPARPYLDLVQPLIEGLGFQLLRIRMTGDDGKMVLQIMAENDDFGLTIEQCESISHTVSDMLRFSELGQTVILNRQIPSDCSNTGLTLRTLSRFTITAAHVSGNSR